MEKEKIEDKIIRKNSPYATPISIIIVGTMISSAVFYGLKNPIDRTSITQNAQISTLEESVIPVEGVVLPVIWGNLGIQLVNSGVIDATKFKAIYEQRGAFSDEYKKLLFGDNNGKIKITNENSGYILNLLWAFGLANKNPILETGEMVDPKYGGAGNFASTGGWTISKSSPMDHYSRHSLVVLTEEQQILVEKISRGVFRPCCGNSTHFPDCNHGMAMLGLLELMASQGVSEQDMWKTALIVNSYWFPDTYITLATYMKNKGVDWKDVNPEEMLSATYSSAQGYAKISSQVISPEHKQQGGGGCGVDTGTPAPAPQRQQNGCGVDAGQPALVPQRQQGGCGI